MLYLDTHTNLDCGIGIMIQMSLKDFYDVIQRDIEIELDSISIPDVISRYENKCGSDVQEENGSF